jgi:hypothetical protein
MVRVMADRVEGVGRVGAPARTGWEALAAHLRERDATLQQLAAMRARDESSDHDVDPGRHQPRSATELHEEQQAAAERRRRDFPPGFVFAPGFIYADRRGLVPYPGVSTADSSIRSFLTRRYPPPKTPWEEISET